MIFDVVSIFPDIFCSFLSESLMAKAIEKKILEVRFSNPRDFTSDAHQTADDRPYGGGPGMVLKPEPLCAAIEAASAGNEICRRVYLSPSGQRLSQKKVRALLQYEKLVLICGRYEGLDQRVIDLVVDEEISIGDYVVNGGEVPAMVLIESIARLIPGFMSKMESAEEESHSSGLLEYPHYTRPPEFRGLEVPEILLSGDHKSVARWRLKESFKRTILERPEMMASVQLDTEALKILAELHRPEHGQAQGKKEKKKKP